MIEKRGIKSPPNFWVSEIVDMASVAIVTFVRIKPPADSESSARHESAQNRQLHIVADIACISVLHFARFTSRMPFYRERRELPPLVNARA
jgi:hypothetical protein